MSLTPFVGNNGIELFIDTRTGETFSSQSGYARMANKTKQAISKRCKGVNPNLFKFAEIQTPGGMQAANLITEDLMIEWLPQDNPEMASNLMRLGARVFLHKLAGYEVTSTATSQPNPQKSPAIVSIDLLKSCLTESGLGSKLISGILLNQALVYDPSLKPAVNEAHALLIASNPQKLLLTPTKVGEKLAEMLDRDKKISAKQINLYLLDMGFQAKNVGKTSKREPSYLVTDLGLPFTYAESRGNTYGIGDNGDNSGYNHLKWTEDVIPEIVKYLRDQETA